MPRPATARPRGEHLAVLARVLRQVEADKELPQSRAKRIKKHLTAAMSELQQEMVNGKQKEEWDD